MLAGPSGAGKSTVIEILLGFVRPDRGRVTINGADIAELVPQALSRLTAWIGQRPVLFAGSIRDNILFARPDATADELAAAVRAARVDEFAAALPDGLGTRVARAAPGRRGAGRRTRLELAADREGASAHPGFSGGEARSSNDGTSMLFGRAGQPQR